METPIISFFHGKFFLLILIFTLFMHILTKNSLILFFKEKNSHVSMKIPFLFFGFYEVFVKKFRYFDFTFKKRYEVAGLRFSRF